MKKIDISRLERLRKMNLKIGYVIALALMLVAFSWTTERPALPDLLDDLPIDAEIEVKRTYQEPEQKEPPLPEVPEKVKIENQIIVASEKPALLATTLTPELPAPELPKGNVTEGPPIPKAAPPKPKIEDKAPPIFKVVEEMPFFGDCTSEQLNKKERTACSDKALLSYLYKNIKYPVLAREHGIEGTLFVQFVVEENGQITNAKVIRDIGGGCGQEALRIIKGMPDWTPGKQRGREVRVQFSLPIKFNLQ